MSESVLETGMSQGEYAPNNSIECAPLHGAGLRLRSSIHARPSLSRGDGRMAADLSNTLVVGISATALFDLNAEDALFRNPWPLAIWLATQPKEKIGSIN